MRLRWRRVGGISLNFSACSYVEPSPSSWMLIGTWKRNGKSKSLTIFQASHRPAHLRWVSRTLLLNMLQRALHKWGVSDTKIHYFQAWSRTSQVAVLAGGLCGASARSHMSST